MVFVLQSCETNPKAPDCITPQELSGATLSQKEYQTIVFNYLENSDPSEYRYFFKTFVDEEDNTYMITNFRNEKTCFDVNVFIADWSKLNGMRKVNGESYPKELRNLKWELKEEMEVHYSDMDDIID